MEQPGTESIVGRPKKEVEAEGLTEGIAAFLEARTPLLRNFVTTPDREGRIGPQSTTEAVLCGMLGGQALYASPWIADRAVVRYLVVFAGRSSSQLGRFVRRLHTLGELRLAALLDLDADPSPTMQAEMSKAQLQNLGLRRAGQEFRRLARQVDEYLSDRKPVDAATVGRLLTHLVVTSRSVAGGIVYRTERASNYAKAFRERLTDLRIVPIPGWQPYDAFVRRYQYQDHDFIASIRRRFEILGSRIDRLMFQHQSRIIEEDRADTGKTLSQIKKIQDRAEDIAVLAGIYYGSQALAHGAANLLPIASVYISERYNWTFEHPIEIPSLIEWVAAGLAVLMIFDIFVAGRRLRSRIMDASRGLTHLFDPLLTLMLGRREP